MTCVMQTLETTLDFGFLNINFINKVEYKSITILFFVIHIFFIYSKIEGLFKTNKL